MYTSLIMFCFIVHIKSNVTYFLKRNKLCLCIVYSKTAWRKVVWDRVWELENVYWRIQTQMHRNLDLLSRVVDEPRYVAWWWLSDRHPNMIRQCETMAKLVCHASMLKSDDVRLKGLNRSHRQCPLCKLAALDDVNHLLLQCPALQPERA